MIIRQYHEIKNYIYLVNEPFKNALLLLYIYILFIYIYYTLCINYFCFITAVDIFYSIKRLIVIIIIAHNYKYMIYKGNISRESNLSIIPFVKLNLNVNFE